MGLDTTHDCWHGAYHAFLRFRVELARAAGLPILERDTPRGPIAEGYDLPWDRFEKKNFMGEWDAAPDDPLFVLLVHSDCDGRIPSQFCGHLASRIEQLIPAMPTDGAGHLQNPQESARSFVKGLRDAAERGEDVEFY